MRAKGAVICAKPEIGSVAQTPVLTGSIEQREEAKEEAKEEVKKEVSPERTVF